MPVAFVAWQKLQSQRKRQRPFASLSRVALLWRNPGKIDTPKLTAAEDKKSDKDGNNKDKEDKDKSKDKEQSPGKEQQGDGKDSKEEAEKKEEDKPKKPGTLGELLKDASMMEKEEKIDKPPAARIVAYSDSEGEDEPFRLTRRRRRKSSEDGSAEAEEGKSDEESSTSKPSQGRHTARQPPRVFRAVRKCGKRGLSTVRGQAGWGLALQLLLLWLFRRWRRKDAQHMELLTLAISIPDALCSTAGWRCPSTFLPGKLQTLVRFVESWGRPAAVFQLERLSHRIWPKKKRRQFLATISQSVRVFEEADLGNHSPAPFRFRQSLPRLASEIAAHYVIELTEMGRILQQHHAKLPPERFDDTNAELLRFAASAGLLQASSSEEKAHAIQEGAQRVLKTLEWSRRKRFMTPAQLKEWHHMVRWQGSDSEGWPILVVKIARACAEYQGDEADSIAEAIIGQMQRALSEVFSNQRGPDKVIVILDATNANSLQAARNVNLVKQTAVTLNRHYPFRLEKLFIVELPSQLRWVLASLKPMLHPSTKQKIQIVASSDPALPLPQHLLQSPREDSQELQSGGSENLDAGKSRRVSIPQLPVSRTPPVRTPHRRPSVKIFDNKAASGSDSDAAEEDDGDRMPSPPPRRVRIMELPFREFQRKPSRDGSRGSMDRGLAEANAFGGFMRPALKRSTSAGLLGLDTSKKEEERPSNEAEQSASGDMS